MLPELNLDTLLVAPLTARFASDAKQIALGTGTVASNSTYSTEAYTLNLVVWTYFESSKIV